MINCQFPNEPIYLNEIITPLYRCVIENQEIPSQVNSESFDGVHQGNRTNDDIKSLEIYSSSFEKFPNGLGDILKNVTYLRIYKSNLREISRENLKQFPELEEINFYESQLENLPKDLFD